MQGTKQPDPGAALETELMLVIGDVTVPLFGAHARTCSMVWAGALSVAGALSIKAISVPSRERIGELVTAPPATVVT
jgi:hypothetical protein